MGKSHLTFYIGDSYICYFQSGGSTCHKLFFIDIRHYLSPFHFSFWPPLHRLFVYAHPIRSYRGCEGRGLVRENGGSAVVTSVQSFFLYG